MRGVPVGSTLELDELVFWATQTRRWTDVVFIAHGSTEVFRDAAREILEGYQQRVLKPEVVASDISPPQPYFDPRLRWNMKLYHKLRKGLARRGSLRQRTTAGNGDRWGTSEDNGG